MAEPAVALAEQVEALPLVGPLGSQVAALWVFADATTSLGQELAQAATSGLASRSAGIGPGLVTAAPVLGEHLAAAERSLARAQHARAQLSPLAGPLQSLESDLARWDSLAPRLEQELPRVSLLARALPVTFGTGPTTYLVLAQTVDELRPTGGFITSIGTVRIEHGRIVRLNFEKVYSAEGLDLTAPRQPISGRYLQPPLPLSRYLGLGQWLLRDANWWADFPASARQAARMWEQTRGERIDGVIAFNELALEALLEAVGPVQLPSGKLISSANVKQETLAEIFRGDQAGEWYAAQSAFSQQLGQALVAAIEQLPIDRALKLGQQLQPTLARHDLLVASFDPVVAAALRALGVDGALQGEQDDFFYPVEANVGYGKLSQLVRRSFEYTVDLGVDGRALRARLWLESANSYTRQNRPPGYPEGYYRGGHWDQQTRRMVLSEGYYGGYTRVVLPPASRFQHAVGFDDGPFVSTEGGRAVVGGYTGLRAGDRRGVLAEWVPGGQPSVSGHYRLLVPRQPGAPTANLTVRAQLPPGYTAASASPKPDSVGGWSVVWRVTLDRDREFRVALAPAEPGPTSRP
jgi:hypothetical protein